MGYLSHILSGIIIAYLAMISPGMLNMTALKVRIEGGKLESFKFSLGASLVILFQAGVALFFADYFVKNPSVIEYIKKIGVVIFFLLAIFFYFLSRKKLKPKTDSGKGNYFMKGILLSFLNMLSIPFYLAISIYMASENYIIIKQPYITFLILGIFIGALLLFYTYIYFSKFITTKVSFIATNINLILSGLFVLLGVVTLVKLLT